MQTCRRCVADLLYCDVHDAYFCPVCDRWIEGACDDPDCTHCVGRATTPGGCEHDPAHHRNFNE